MNSDSFKKFCLVLSIIILATGASADFEWLNIVEQRSPDSGSTEFYEAHAKNEEVLLVGRNSSIALINSSGTFQRVFWDTPQDAVRGSGILGGDWLIYTDRLHRSVDGLEWIEVPEAPTGAKLFSVVEFQKQDRLILGMENGLYLADNTQTWTSVSSPFGDAIVERSDSLTAEHNLTFGFYDQGFHDVATKENMLLVRYSFFFPGSIPGEVDRSDLIFKSENLIDWAVAEEGLGDAFNGPVESFESIANVDLNGSTFMVDRTGSVLVFNEATNDWEQVLDIAANDSLRLGVGWTSGTAILATSADGSIYKLDSTDLASGWGEHSKYLSDNPGLFRGVAFGNGRFVAINSNGKVYVSLAGDQWSSYPLPGTPEIDDRIRFIDGVFLLTKINLKTVSHISVDGISWSPVEESVVSFTRASGKYLRVVDKPGSGNPNLQVIENSADGVNWIERFNAARSTTVFSDGTIAYAEIDEVPTSIDHNRRFVSTDGGDTWAELDSPFIPVAARNFTRFPDLEGENVDIKVPFGVGDPKDFPQTITRGELEHGRFFLNDLDGFIIGGAYGHGTLVLVGSDHSIFQTRRDPNLGTSNLVNLSTRGLVGDGERSLVLGFVNTGSSESYLLRGAGPSLTEFGVADPLGDPFIRLFQGESLVSENDDWSNGTNSEIVGATFGERGAFPFPDQSKDSALLEQLGFGSYTVVFTGNPDQKEALIELYSETGTTSGLSNLSSRGYVDPEMPTMIGGVVVRGEEPVKLLIRGVGPGLAPFNITEFLQDPVLRIFQGEQQLFSSQSNGDDDLLRALSDKVGAFELTQDDAALRFTAPPGAYTIHLESESGSSGICLLELYVVD